MSTRSFYFALSDFDRNWGIHVLDCGTIHRKPDDHPAKTNHPEPYRLTWERGRILEEYQLIYLLEGNGWFESKPSGLIPLASESIVLIVPGLWHRYKPLEDSPWRTYWVGFGGAFTKRLIGNVGITQKTPTQLIGYQEDVLKCFQDIIVLAQHELSGYQQVMAGEVVKLLGLVRALQQRAIFHGTNTDALIQSAKSLLIQAPPEHALEDIANELNMGYSKFRRLFKNYTGISPGKFQLQHRIARASQLLQYSELSIAEVAYRCGFDTPQYFTRIYKRKTGTSPSKYRRQFGSR